MGTTISFIYCLFLLLNSAIQAADPLTLPSRTRSTYLALYILMQATTLFKQNVKKKTFLIRVKVAFFLFLAVMSALKAFTQQRWRATSAGL